MRIQTLFLPPININRHFQRFPRVVGNQVYLVLLAGLTTLFLVIRQMSSEHATRNREPCGPLHSFSSHHPNHAILCPEGAGGVTSPFMFEFQSLHRPCTVRLYIPS